MAQGTELLIFGDDLVPVGGICLLVDIVDMGFHGAQGDEQLLTDFLLALGLEQVRQNLLFPLCQVIGATEGVQIQLVPVGLRGLLDRSFHGDRGVELQLAGGVAENRDSQAQIHEVFAEISVIDLHTGAVKPIPEENHEGVLRQDQNAHNQEIQEKPLQHTPVEGAFHLPQGNQAPAADADGENLGDEIVAEYHPVVLGNHGDADQHCGIEENHQYHLF